MSAAHLIVGLFGGLLIGYWFGQEVIFQYLNVYNVDRLACSGHEISVADFRRYCKK